MYEMAVTIVILLYHYNVSQKISLSVQKKKCMSIVQDMQ